MILSLFYLACLYGSTTPEIQNPRLIEELIVGGDETDESQYFSPTSSFTVDARGTIYVLDPGNFRVAIYDANGRHLRNFGNKGKGPGEFGFPLGIGLDRSERIVIFDILNRRVMTFAPDGQLFGEEKLLDDIQAVYQPSFCENGNILLPSVRTDLSFSIYYDLTLFNRNLEVVAPLQKVVLPKREASRASENYWVDFLVQQFEAMAAGLPLSAAIDGRTLVIAQSGAYEGRIIDQNGHQIAQFKGNLAPKPFTISAQEAFFGARWETFRGSPLADNMPQSVFEKALARAKKPPILPPLTALAAYRNGFAAIANYDHSTQSGRLEWFGTDGVRRAGTAYTGPNAKVMGCGDKLYCAGNDFNDNFVIKRFALMP